MSEQDPAGRGPGTPGAAPGSPSFPTSAPSSSGPAPTRSGAATSGPTSLGSAGSERTLPATPGHGQSGPTDGADTAETVPGGADHETDPPGPLKVPHTRASATYIGVAVGLVILILVIIFIAQNLKKVKVNFLSLHFRFPLGLVVLAAAVAGGLIVLLVSLVRVLQLRLMARRHRRAHENA